MAESMQLQDYSYSLVTCSNLVFYICIFICILITVSRWNRTQCISKREMLELTKCIRVNSFGKALMNMIC